MSGRALPAKPPQERLKSGRALPAKPPQERREQQRNEEGGPAIDMLALVDISMLLLILSGLEFFFRNPNFPHIGPDTAETQVRSKMEVKVPESKKIRALLSLELEKFL